MAEENKHNIKIDIFILENPMYVYKITFLLTKYNEKKIFSIILLSQIWLTTLTFIHVMYEVNWVEINVS